MMTQLYSILLFIFILGPLAAPGETVISRGDHSIARIDNAPVKSRLAATEGSVLTSRGTIEQNPGSNKSKLKRQSLSRPGSISDLINRAHALTTPPCESSSHSQQIPTLIRQHFIRLPGQIDIANTVQDEVQRPSPEQPLAERVVPERVSISISSGNGVQVPVSSGVEQSFLMGPVLFGDGSKSFPSIDDGKKPFPSIDDSTPFVINGQTGKQPGKKAVVDQSSDDDDSGEIVMRPKEWRCMDSEGLSGVQTLVCPPGMMITGYGLVSAGNPQGSCAPDSRRLQGSCHIDLIPYLDQKNCSGKATCTIDAISDKSFSGQCPGSFNASNARVLAEFECSPWRSAPEPKQESNSKCQQIRDNGTLFCSENQVITGFGFAFFGEMDGSCSAGIEPGLCSRNVLTDITGQCVGKSSCPIDASVKSLGVPCAHNSTVPLTLAANFRCGLPSEVAANVTGGLAPRQGYNNGSLTQQFKAGNTAQTNSFGLGITLAIMAGFVFIA